MIRRAAIGSGLVENVHARAWQRFPRFLSMTISARGWHEPSAPASRASSENEPGRRSVASNCRATQRARLTLLVRALDGEQEGVSRREIAAVLLDAEARHLPAIEWKNAALRKRVNRVVASQCVALMNGGYLALLRGDPTRAQRFRRP